jgi:hypothetical protein
MSSLQNRDAAEKQKSITSTLGVSLASHEDYPQIWGKPASKRNSNAQGLKELYLPGTYRVRISNEL